MSAAHEVAHDGWHKPPAMTAGHVTEGHEETQNPPCAGPCAAPVPPTGTGPETRQDGGKNPCTTLPQEKYVCANAETPKTSSPHTSGSFRTLAHDTCSQSPADPSTLSQLHAHDPDTKEHDMSATNPLIPERLPEWVAENLDAIVAFGPLDTPARGCFVLGCRRDASRAGLCRAHFVRARDTFGPVPPSRDSAARQRARAEQTGVGPASPGETEGSGS